MKVSQEIMVIFFPFIVRVSFNFMTSFQEFLEVKSL